jgi:coproporphyrinogen III oxidase-like Fe-S oxidoreductase
MPKKLYRMSEAELAEMTKIAQMPVMYLGGGTPIFDHQEAANTFWKKLAKLYGFLWHSVEPAPGADLRSFLAEPIEPGK